MKTREQYLFIKQTLLLFAGVFLVGVGCESLQAVKQEKISEFGKYQGYTEKIYDGYKRTSVSSWF